MASIHWQLVFLEETNFYSSKIFFELFKSKNYDRNELIDHFYNPRYGSTLFPIKYYINFLNTEGFVYGGMDIIRHSYLENMLCSELNCFISNEKILNKYCELFQLYFPWVNKREYSDFKKYSIVLLGILDDIKVDSDDFLKRAINSNLVLAKQIKKGTLSELIKSSDRDKEMAKNLMYYIKKYPDKKIVISTSTYHITKSQSKKNITMVDFLPDSIKDRGIIIPIIYYKGTIGVKNLFNDALNFERNILRSNQSLENYLFELDSNNIKYYNIKKLYQGNKNNLETRNIESMNILYSRASILNIFHGVIFVPEMMPVIIRENNEHKHKQLDKILRNFKCN